MCHRLCVTFSLKELQALVQMKRGNQMIGPNYVALGTKLEPIQTYNAPSNSPCPILLSEKHIYDGMPSNSIVLALMQWGLSPSWVVEGKAQLKYRLTHVKKENLTRNKIFETLLKKGHRCVLVCEGFYQFVTSSNKPNKRVYFLHLQNLFDQRIEREVIRPCYIAALFDTLKQPDGRDLYSFTIITIDTPSELTEKLNPRIPVIFNRPEEMFAWLDYERVQINDALHLLQHQIDHLIIDPVSHHVFKKSHTGPECIQIVHDEKYLSSNVLEPDDDVNIKPIKSHLENVEDQHQKKMAHLIEKHQEQSEKALTRADLLYDQSVVCRTLEALSDRTEILKVASF